VAKNDEIFDNTQLDVKDESNVHESNHDFTFQPRVHRIQKHDEVAVGLWELVDVSLLVEAELRLMVNAIFHWSAEDLVHTAHFEETTTAIIVTFINSINLSHHLGLLNQINKIQVDCNAQHVTPGIVFLEQEDPKYT
jgi:hypothetical protein